MNIKSDPIIILGMHRSGTQIYAELLKEAGIFFGNDVKGHFESRSFRDLNKKILRIAHADWDNPVNIRFLFNEEISLRNTANLIDKEIKGNKFRKKYLGFLRLLQKDKKELWGWKDPRTTITFPVWNLIFPDAKFLIIYRNGIDVAKSLYAREEGRIGRVKNKAYSLRCRVMGEAYKLWEEYNYILQENLDKISSNRKLTVRYEDLLTNPDNELKRIFEFLCISMDNDLLEKMISRINKGNVYKFVNDKDLIRLYNKVKNRPLMKKFGYDSIL